jgi:uncharacterized protein YbjT (DUF2867 family)
MSRGWRVILVTGASGNVGGELVQLLQRRGQPVRALIHGSRPSWLRDTAVVDGDLDQPATWHPRCAAFVQCSCFPAIGICPV